MDDIRIVAEDCIQWLDRSLPPRVYFAGSTSILQYKNAPAPNLEICYQETGAIEELHVGDQVVDIPEGFVSINNLHFGNTSPAKGMRGCAWCAIIDISKPSAELAYVMRRPVIATAQAQNPAEIRDVFRRLRRHCARQHVSPYGYSPSVVMFDPDQARDDAAGVWRLKGLLMELFSLVLESANKSSTGRETLSEPIGRARDAMEEQFADPDLTLAHLARLACLSTAQFGRRFTIEMGEAPMDYVARLRLREAALLLRHTRQSVGDIAMSVGYSDPLYFSKMFRRAYGLSPRAFRWANAPIA